MTTLFLAPVDEDSYRATLEEEIDLSDWNERPPEFPVKARVWGVRTDMDKGRWSRNRNSWEQMSEGDPMLFYRKGNYGLFSKPKYFARGRVGAMCETEYIRDRFWSGGPAVSVFAVEDYSEDISLNRNEVNEILGYKEQFWPQGLRKVDDERPVDRLLQRAGFEDF